MLELRPTLKSNGRLRLAMESHYSQPKGFVGRSLLYEILYRELSYGFIVAGSATWYLPGRPTLPLNSIVNNTFYHVAPVNGEYPRRNFTTFVLEAFLEKAKREWARKYGDTVLAFETLVEPPRTGELYLRAGFQEIGMTKGFQVKRGPGPRKGDGWGGGERVWDKENLRPKRILWYQVDNPIAMPAQEEAAVAQPEPRQFSLPWL